MFKGIGEQGEKQSVLEDEEIEKLNAYRDPDNESTIDVFKELLNDHAWTSNEDILLLLKGPLMRLCARYLYLEKRRGYAMNPVGKFTSHFRPMKSSN